MTSEFTIAVHALVFLNHKGPLCFPAKVLLQIVCTNAARIRKVMAKLKKADLVKTKEGVDGGYLFHRDSRDVNLSMVAEALDTPLWLPPGKAAIRIWPVSFRQAWRESWTSSMVS
ncbi:MAG: RrF2 family transcriptional regulator [Enterocloster sp.]